MEENILEVKNLCKSFRGTKALKDISISIPRGKIVGLLGPNGSGKTTLIKIINDLVHGYAGEVLIEGKEPGIESKKIISFLPDTFYLDTDSTPLQCAGFFKDFYSDFNKENAISLFDKLDIDKNKKLKTFSKGTQEKVALSLVMSRKAKLYILDEPIAGVDPASRDLILKTIIGNFEENGSMLISTHIISDMENIFDNCIFLKEGEVYLQDDVEKIREEKNKSIDQLFRDVFACK